MGTSSVSVVIPTHNRQNNIAFAIASVEEQTFKADEIIIIDDGSTDSTPEFLKNHLCRSCNTRIVVITQNNKGPAAARNAGINAATCDYVAFLDDDDYWLPHKIARQMQILKQEPDIVLLGCSADTFFLRNMRRRMEVSELRLLIRNWFLTPGVIVKRKELLEIGGFPEDMKCCEDYALWLKLVIHHRCVFLNEILVKCGYGKPPYGHSGLSGDLVQLRFGEFEALAKWRQERNSKYSLYLFALFLAILRHWRRFTLTVFRNLK
jgi:glycosyltransferase involved in cell wall biosynthesis